MSLVRETADFTWTFRASVRSIDVTDVPQANHLMGISPLTRYPVIKGLDISEGSSQVISTKVPAALTHCLGLEQLSALRTGHQNPRENPISTLQN